MELRDRKGGIQRGARQVREPRQARGRATRSRVIQVTSELVEKQGYERTSMAQIAERAGIGTTTLYHHFPDKQSIMLAIIDEWSEQIGTDRRSDMHVETLVEGDDPRAALASLVHRMYEQLQRQHWIHAELFLLILRDEKVSRRSQNLYQASIERFAAMIELGQRRGLLRSEVDPISAASLLCNALEGLMSRMLVRHAAGTDPERMVAQLIDMFGRYLVKDA